MNLLCGTFVYGFILGVPQLGITMFTSIFASAVIPEVIEAISVRKKTQ